MPGFPVLCCLLEFAHTHVHWVQDAIQPCHPLSPLLLLLSIFSDISLFQWVGSSHQISKILELRLQYQLLWEYSGLTSCRIHSFDFLGLKGTLKSLLQHHNWKASILQHSGFFMVQLSHLYTITAKKNHSFDYMDFVGKAKSMLFFFFLKSMLFNMLSRFVMAFLPRNKHLLISWLQSPATVILEPKKTKSFTVLIVSPSTYHEGMRPYAIVLVFWMLSFKPTF